MCKGTVQRAAVRRQRTERKIVLVDYTEVIHRETDNTVEHTVTDYSNGEVVALEETCLIIHDGSVRSSSTHLRTNKTQHLIWEKGLRSKRASSFFYVVVEPPQAAGTHAQKPQMQIWNCKLKNANSKMQIANWKMQIENCFSALEN